MKSIKNLSLVGLCFVALFLMTCSKKDDPAPSIVGSWLHKTIATTSCTTSSLNEAEIPCSPCATITFKSDNTLTEVYPASTFSPAITVTGTYSISGSTLTATRTFPSTSIGGLTIPSVTFTTVWEFTVTSTTLTTTEPSATTGPGCKFVVAYTRL